MRHVRRFGVQVTVTRKGGIIAELGEGGEPLCVTAHPNNIGLMVRHVFTDRECIMELFESDAGVVDLTLYVPTIE